MQHDNKKLIREIEEQRKEVERLIGLLGAGVGGLAELEEEAREAVEGEGLVVGMDELVESVGR